MASLRAIKRRIQTVKNTAQVTKAMQMISANKMKQAEKLAKQTIPYTEGLFEVVRRIGKITDYSSPLLKRSANVRNIAVVVIGPSRGFVGGLITNLTVNTIKAINDLKLQNPGANVLGVSVHRKALNIVTNLGIEDKYHFAKYFDHPTTTELSSIYSTILNGFMNEEFDEVYLAYMHFVNTMVQKPVFKRLLPIKFDVTDEKKENTFIFEPSKSTILDFVLPEYFESEVLTAILDSNASEQSARMVAMKSATDNAKAINKELSLQYNSTRQAKITNEILEIVSNA
jgi:F-type H+-transporting ATPase subunit gamma